MRGTVSTNLGSFPLSPSAARSLLSARGEAMIEVDSRIGPQQRPDLLARHDSAWLVEQQPEQPQRLAAQAHGLAAAREPER
jgi:hypothetical protein